MITDIFYEFLEVFNKEMQKENRKTILLLGNCFPHINAAKKAEFSNVNIKFFYPNLTSVIQPSILESFAHSNQTTEEVF